MTIEQPASPVRVLGISGSLRKASFNTALLRAAAELLPPAMSLEIADLSALPLFNQDLVAPDFPEPARDLRSRIAAADALLIATPEYNTSVPAVLKNAIDWASRPPNQLNDKPVAAIGASPGGFGTVRVQLHLRQILIALNAHPLYKPDLLLSHAQEKFDAEGRLIDASAQKTLGEVLTALGAWTRRLRGH